MFTYANNKKQLLCILMGFLITSHCLPLCKVRFASVPIEVPNLSLSAFKKSRIVKLK